MKKQEMAHFGILVAVAILALGIIVPAHILADSQEREAHEIRCQELGENKAAGEESPPYGASVACWEEVEAERKAEEEQEAKELREVEREVTREKERHRREWAHKPTVTLNIARHAAKQRLNKAGFGDGWVECKGGRLSRTRWSCRISLFYHCERSRMQVWGAGYRDHRPYFGTRAGHFHPCRI